jgi:hypothetical protein
MRSQSEFDYKSAVAALKALREVIYSKEDRLGPLGQAFNLLCNQNAWCIESSFNAGEPVSCVFPHLNTRASEEAYDASLEIAE